jgi:hypothetical protein
LSDDPVHRANAHAIYGMLEALPRRKSTRTPALGGIRAGYLDKRVADV